MNDLANHNLMNKNLIDYEVKIWRYKMLDVFTMVILLILHIIFMFVVLLMYLIILGGSNTKSDEERFYEDKEQMDYLKKYKNKESKK